MASNVQQYQGGSNSSPHHCKECGIYMNSAESLEVHLQYHKENLLNKWATQAAHSEETNNNSTNGKGIKREFISNTIAAAADSSDSMLLKKSPEYGSRATPETIFGHPPTPQSYHSASSPYQTPDNSAFSPGFPNFPIKTERSSPNPHYQAYPNFQDSGFFNMEQQYNPQDYHKMQQQQGSFRYHPYQQGNGGYERNSQVSSSSPAYPPQPTPSPSPKQCDKCGYVCESATQLIEHLNVAHPPTPAPHLGNYQQGHFIFGGQEIKTEEDSEILDLDSHKVVHQVYQEDEKRDLSNGHNPHSVSAMLNSWPQHTQVPHQQQRMYIKSEPFQNGMEQKLFQPHASEYGMGGGVTTTTQEQPPQPYRPFDHLPPQSAAPLISSTQVPTATVPPPAANPKSSNWKSNEARRPKTYNCTACNKWFTSSGHLKRHYNTTLHKNAVKSSGQPDPATLPISAHHHPARESTASREDHSRSPTEDSRSEDGYERPGGIPGLLQQPPAGPYDRQPAPNIHHPMHNHLPASPPNGEAGPSATVNQLDSRGLLSMSNTNHNPPPQQQQHQQQHGYNIPPPMDQFQMYPNECAPHVTQATVTNSRSTTGEFEPEYQKTCESQPLPSFAQFNSRFGLLLGYNVANVGGPGPATAPYTYYTNDADPHMYYQEEEDYRLTVLTAAEEPSGEAYPTHNNNNNILVERKINTIDDLKIKFETQPASPEKAHIKRDYEETAGGSPRITSTTVAQAPTKNGLHKCYDCDKIFNKSCYLTQHNKTFHNGDKPFKCTKCGKRFSGNDQYQEHLSKHAGEKPHKCDLCPKQFNHKTDLRRHMCLHTGQKPYACDTCGKGFIRKDHMLKHCETHTKKPHAKHAQVRYLLPINKK